MLAGRQALLLTRAQTNTRLLSPSLNLISWSEKGLGNPTLSQKLFLNCRWQPHPLPSKEQLMVSKQIAVIPQWAREPLLALSHKDWFSNYQMFSLSLGKRKKKTTLRPSLKEGWVTQGAVAEQHTPLHPRCCLSGAPQAMSNVQAGHYFTALHMEKKNDVWG